MICTIKQALLCGMAVLMLVPTLALAGAPATVTSVGSKNTVTVKTDDGKEYQVQMRGVREGDQVDCDVSKDGKATCQEKKSSAD